MDAILVQAARFARKVLAPLDRSGDREGARWTEEGVRMPAGFVDAWQQFSQAGWINQWCRVLSGSSHWRSCSIPRTTSGSPA